MDVFTTSDIIMNCDSDDSDLDFSGDDFDIQTSDSESDDDAVQAASSAQLLTSQARTAQQQSSWRPAGRQPQATVFIGIQGPTNQVVVTDEKESHTIL